MRGPCSTTRARGHPRATAMLSHARLSRLHTDKRSHVIATEVSHVYIAQRLSRLHTDKRSHVIATEVSHVYIAQRLSRLHTDKRGTHLARPISARVLQAHEQATHGLLVARSCLGGVCARQAQRHLLRLRGRARECAALRGSGLRVEGLSFGCRARECVGLRGRVRARGGWRAEARLTCQWAWRSSRRCSAGARANTSAAKPVITQDALER